MSDNTHDSTQLEDDGSSQLIVIDDDGPQSLWVRVGPIFYDEIGDEPGVWIGYQEKHMDSDLLGPVLIPAKLWDELDKAVRKRIAKFDKDNYGPRK